MLNAGPPVEFLLGERRPTQAYGAGSRGLAEQQTALGAAHCGDDEYGEEHECDYGGEFREQQGWVRPTAVTSR